MLVITVWTLIRKCAFPEQRCKQEVRSLCVEHTVKGALSFQALCMHRYDFDTTQCVEMKDLRLTSSPSHSAADY